MPLPRLMIVAGRDQASRRLMDTLKEQGYPLCRRVDSGPHAVRLGGRERPDLYLVHIDLPGKMDGIDTAAHIRRRVESPVVLVTDRVEEAEVSRVKQALLHGYLLKPLTAAKIKAVLEIALYTAQVERERRRAEQALQEGREQLALSLRMSARQLEETNTALKVLMEHRGREREELEQQVAANVKRLIMPALGRLGRGDLSPEQSRWLGVVEEGLKELTSPMARKLSSALVGLTPRELEVANLVRQGRTSRQIARMLGVSANSVIFHRQNIRAKLGLKNRKVNLSGYLRHMAEG